MAITPDTFIQNAILRLQFYVNAIDNMSGDLITKLYAPPEIKAPLPGEETDSGTPSYIAGLESGTDLAEKLPDPTTDAPTTAFNGRPTFDDKSLIVETPALLEGTTVDLPDKRDAPGISLDGFFAIDAPSNSITLFTDAAPTINTDDLDDLIRAITIDDKPANSDSISISAIGDFGLGNAPSTQLSNFSEQPDTEDILTRPQSYNWYNRYSETVRDSISGFVDDQVTAWMTTYAPEYSEWQTNLQARVTDSLSNNQVLPDTFETALVTRARSRVEQDFNSVQQGFQESFAQSGFVEPPGVIMGASFDGAMRVSSALSNQSTDIYLERRRSEVQHLQYVMNLAATQVQGLRNLAVQYASTALGVMTTAKDFSTAISDYLIKYYDHLLAYGKLSLSITEELRAQYEANQKTASINIDNFRASLDSERLRLDGNLGEIQLLNANINRLELDVKRYQVLIDAVMRRSELINKETALYELKANVSKNNNEAVLAATSAYKALLEGDNIKADGEMKKLDAFEKLIQADIATMSVQVEKIKADQTYNENIIKNSLFQHDLYAREVGYADRKFEQSNLLADKLQADYAQSLKNHLDMYAAKSNRPRTEIEVAFKEFEGKMQASIKNAEIRMSQWEAYEKGVESGINAFQQLAASSSGSLNSMVSASVSTTE